MSATFRSRPTETRWGNSELLLALATSLIVLGVYLFSIAPDLTWANAAPDGVELVTASATLGIPHPPGYPTYVILGKIFSWLPLGTVAFRYNLFSAVATAGAAGILVLAIRAHHSRIRPAAAMSASLLFAFAPLVWSQAVVAEIYGLNLLVLTVFLLIWLRRGATFWSGFWLGLAMTTHLTSIFFLPALLFAGGRNLLRPIAGMIAGLFPLLLLPLLAAGNSPVVWGEPTSLHAWWWLVSGRLYAANLRPALDFDHLAGIFRALALGPAAIAGASHAMAEPPRLEELVRPGEQRARRLLVFTASIYIAFALLYHTPDAAVNLLPALMILSLLIAPVLDRLGKAALLLPLVLVTLTFSARDLSGEREVRPNALRLLNEAPEDALLLTPGNRTIFTIFYFQHIENVRSDIRVADANLFAFDWYRDQLREQHPELFVPEGDDLAAFQRVNAESRPFCLADLVPSPGASADDRRIARLGSVASPQLECINR